MLPIDQPTAPAEELLRASGVSVSELYAVLHLDKRDADTTGEVFLCLIAEGQRLLRLIPSENKIEELLLADYTQPYVDSYLSACRLLAVRTPPDGEAYTVALGDGTNACRSRLFVFLSVMEALMRGQIMSGEEALFAPLRKPEAERHTGSERRRALRRVLSYFLKNRAMVALGLIMMGAEMLVDLLRPYISGRILFDNIITEGGKWHNLPSLLICLFVLVGLALLRWVAILVRQIGIARMNILVGARLRSDIYTAMQRQSLSYYTQSSIGQQMQPLGADVMMMRSFFTESTFQLVIYTIEFLAVGVMLFILNWRLSLIILLPIPAIILIYRKAFPILRRLNIRAAREGSAVASRVNDSLNGIRVVKAFSRERDEADRLSERLDRLYRVNLRANLMDAILGPAVALLVYLASQAIWGIGGLYVMGGELTYGDFCTYLGYIGMVFAPMQFFASFATRTGQAANSAERIVRILDAVPEVAERAEPLRPTAVRGEIEFSGVSFHYVPSRPILRGVSFRIAEGEHIGLVGHTGSGKSTIANLILRLYDVTGGRILLDGQDVRDLSFDTLRRSISIVSQEVHIFRGTVADNIRFARPNASEEEVIAAARAAGAHDFIMALSDGYDTQVGGGGRMLSGGERQRISIARAIITQPRILILDEATAAMDNETEQRIANAISHLIKGRTTISIAHRLSTLRDCDRIMAIEGGRLVESGTREELLARKGVFYKLYTLQNEQLEQVLKGVTENETV